MKHFIYTSAVGRRKLIAHLPWFEERKQTKRIRQSKNNKNANAEKRIKDKSNTMHNVFSNFRLKRYLLGENSISTSLK